MERAASPRRRQYDVPAAARITAGVAPHVITREAERGLDVRRGENLHADDAARETWRMLVDDAQRILSELLLAALPVTFAESV